MCDNAHDNVIDNITVYNIGEEGIGVYFKLYL
jgi:hypothetical protein